MIKGKKGWIRILEATIAIMLVSGVLLVMYSRSVDKVDISERVYSLQQEVLMDIALDSVLRQNVLDVVLDDDGKPEEEDVNLKELNLFADTKMPDAFNFRVRVCALGVPCKLNSTDVRDTRNKDVYVEDIVLAGTHDNYDPKKVRLFVWES
jgi:hypothetical protein